MNAKRNKNPLYVVTNKGRDVEAADSIWEVFVKTAKLEPFFEALKELFEFLWLNARSLVWIKAIEDCLAQLQLHWAGFHQRSFWTKARA